MNGNDTPQVREHAEVISLPADLDGRQELKSTSEPGVFTAQAGGPIPAGTFVALDRGKDTAGKAPLFSLLVDLWPYMRGAFEHENRTYFREIDYFFELRGTALLAPLTDQAKHIAEVRKFSLTKYSDPNSWRRVPLQEWREAAARHAWAYLTGEDNDPESKLLHMGHFWTNCLFIHILETEAVASK